MEQRLRFTSSPGVSSPGVNTPLIVGVVVTLAILLMTIGVTIIALNIIFSYKKRTRKEQEYTNSTPEVELLKIEVTDGLKKGEFPG